LSQSTDDGYDGLDAADVPVSNVDMDGAGINVIWTPSTGLTTTEAGGTATFTIALSSQPTGAVTIALSSSDTGEGTVSPASVTFTSSNWAAPQTVTVTGVDDLVADGNQPYTIVTAPATGSGNYGGLDAANVPVTNIDNDSAGITVIWTPQSGLTTTEAGGNATFAIVLNSQPTANVAIALASSDTTEGTVFPALLTFTAVNWNAPQTVTVTGVDDGIQDGNQVYAVVTAAATSTDPNYAGTDPPNVPISNTDNDSAGITVRFTPSNGLTTTEAGGSATFTIVLNSEPTDGVTIGLSSSDLSEGTVAPASVTFTALNWNAPQSITVTGVDDTIRDGNVVYSIVTAAATSSDANYQGMNPPDVPCTNTDNDTAGVTVTAAPGLSTTEAGGTATFTIRLTVAPIAPVTIDLTSNDPTEGTVAPASITFTSANWNAPQTITVTGVDDQVQDGNQPYGIITSNTISTDPGYNGLVVSNVSVTNIDNDTAGVTVTAASNLTTAEGVVGHSNTFSIVLNSEPTQDVTISLSSSDLSEGTVAPAIVTFTAINWNAPRIITVTGVDDFVADGDQPYTIQTSAAVSGDPNYSGLVVADVAITNIDNDSAGVTIAPTVGLITTEAGGTAKFTIVLNSQPTANVSINLSSSDLSEGTVAPGSVTFTPSNWSAPQTVTVTGVDDLVTDGDQPFTVVTSAASSGDPGYHRRPVPDVSVANIDNDAAGVIIFPSTGLTTGEAGGVALFTVTLTAQPTASVTIPLSSSDTSEGTVSPASLLFTPANWNIPQPVTVTGVDDTLQDGNQPYFVVTGAAVSADSWYSGLNPPDAALTNIDDDSPGITITYTSSPTTTEAGGTATFSVVLNTIPTAPVTLPLESSNPFEGTMLPTTITFTAANWNVPRTVTVTGIDDLIDDGDQPYLIITHPLVSADPGYSGLDPADLSLQNIDDD
jgi:hypothetical protein